MIWDRFDDAHDDLLKDINKKRSEVDELKAKLTEAGISYKPYTEPKSGGEPGRAMPSANPRQNRALGSTLKASILSENYY